MNRKNKKGKFHFIIKIAGMVISVCLVLVLIAYSRTWGKTELEFNIHINEELVLQSVFGESPTFAIWIENPETGATQTVFVTGRAGLDDWEGKHEVPVALPQWDAIKKHERPSNSRPEEDDPHLDGITGATPKPGYFTTRVRVEPGSKWICWIEMNLSGDYNEYYREYDEKGITLDEYGDGQPALVYRTEIEAVKGNQVVPEVKGMSLLNTDAEKIIRPVDGMTTALDVFDEISVAVVSPKPKIIAHR